MAEIRFTSDAVEDIGYVQQRNPRPSAWRGSLIVSVDVRGTSSSRGFSRIREDWDPDSRPKLDWLLICRTPAQR